MSCQYTVAVSDSVGSDVVRSALYRCSSHPNDLIRFLQDGTIKTAYDIFQRGLRTSRNSRCLGKRQHDHVEGYVWSTYAEVERMACLLGSGILHRELVVGQRFPDESYQPSRELSIIGVISKNCVEWFFLEQAANYYSFTLVPLYSTLGSSAIKHILIQTRMRCVAAAESDLLEIMKILQEEGSERMDTLKSVILLDNPSDTAKALALQLGLDLYDWRALTELAALKGLVAPRIPGPEDVQTICYTSGTTGVPKGVLITHQMFAVMMNAAAVGPLAPGEVLKIRQNDTHLSYLPLAHVLERAVTSLMWYHGARIAVYGGEPKGLMDDIKAASPTIFVSVPKLFVRIYNKIMRSVEQSSSIVRYSFKRAVASKVEELRRSGRCSSFFWDNIVFYKPRALMGGSLRYMLSGGAALESDIQEKLGVIFGVDFLEGYGATEAMGCIFIRRGRETLYGHVGGPLPSVEFVFEQVPNMPEYDPLSESEPAGHLLIRGAQVMPGYFHDKEATKKAISADGFLRTGDVAVRLENGGRIKIIDRVKNLFKLSQGEYVAPERLELIYAQAPLVSQLFIHGDDRHSYVVAVVCIDEQELKKKFPRILEFGSKEWHQDPLLIKTVKEELDEQARISSLAGFETIKAIFIWEDQFSSENNLLTPTFKLKRNVALKRFRKEINHMLDTIE